MSNPVNVIKLEKLNEKIQELEFVKGTIILCLQSPEETIRQYIFKRYVEIQNTAFVAEHMNKSGYMFHDRKYISNDIGDLIKKADEEIPLEKLAKTLYRFNKSKITWSTVIKVCEEIRPR